MGIRNAKTRPLSKVCVEGFGELFLKPFSARQAIELQQLAKDTEQDKARHFHYLGMLIVSSVVNENGEPELCADDVDMVLDQGLESVDALVNEILKLNKMRPEDIEASKKDSGKLQNSA